MVTRRDIVCALRELGINPTSDTYNESVIDYLIKVFNLKQENLSTEDYQILHEVSDYFSRRVKNYYVERPVNRTYERLFKTKFDWLNTKVENPLKNESKAKAEKAGRPKKSFEEKGRTAKFNEAKAIADNNSKGAILRAAVLSSTSEKEHDCAFVLKKLENDPKTQGSEIRGSIKKDKKRKGPIPMTPAEALAHIIMNRLTRQQYESIRRDLKKRHANVYPAYNYVISEKLLCMPKNVEFLEDEAKVKMQDSLDHQISRYAIFKDLILLRPSITKNYTYYIIPFLSL